MTGAGYLQPHVALVGDDPDVRSGAGDRKTHSVIPG